MTISLSFAHDFAQALLTPSHSTAAPATPSLPAASGTGLEFNLIGRRTCLSVDGRGLRGVFPAAILAHIEQNLGRPISSVFTAGLTGTSTGALIVLGLAAFKRTTNPFATDVRQPLFTAQELVNFYKEHKSEIFNDHCCLGCQDNNPQDSTGHNCTCCSCFGDCLKSMLWRCLTCFGCCSVENCCGLCGSRYDRSHFEQLLRATFGDRKLKDTLVPVQVVTFDLLSNSPIVFNSVDHGDMSMVDVALASTAAPTFFPPVEIRDSEGVVYQCADGGMHENNPVFSALAFTIENYRKEFGNELDLNSVRILSVGTGRKNRIASFDGFNRSGLCGLVRPIIEISMDGTSEAAHRNIALILGKNENYVRIQVNLDSQDSKMDDPKVVDHLHSVANQLCASHTDLQRFLSYLSRGQLLLDEDRTDINQSNILQFAQNVLPDL